MPKRYKRNYKPFTYLLHNAHVVEYYKHITWACCKLSRPFSQIVAYTHYKLEINPNWNAIEEMEKSEPNDGLYSWKQHPQDSTSSTDSN